MPLRRLHKRGGVERAGGPDEYGCLWIFAPLLMLWELLHA